MTNRALSFFKKKEKKQLIGTDEMAVKVGTRAAAAGHHATPL